MKYQKWNIAEPVPKNIEDDLGFSNVESTILFNRGIDTSAKVNDFLFPKRQSVHDPFLFSDMQKVVDRLSKAVDNREIIGVFGDFDTDGLSGSAVLAFALESLGAIVFPYIPHRVEEGHGVSTNALEFFQDRGVSLILTVDCGISSVDEINLANNMNIETIISDHHTSVDELPEAFAIINPSLPNSKYPFEHLTGVGTAFKIIEALFSYLGRDLPPEVYVFSAFGTLSDVGLMKDENRFLTYQGIKLIRSQEITGIDQLIEVAGIEKRRIRTQDMTFGLIPRINAPGRLSHAKLSLDLILSKNSEDAKSLSEQIEQLNKQRQLVTENAMNEAYQQIKPQNESVIFVGKPNWNPGILGLIAGRLAEEFYRPVIAVSGSGNVLRASGRSIPDFNLIQALDLCNSFFEKFGGHPMAAGFTIQRDLLKDFREKFNEISFELLSDVPNGPSVNIDAEISPLWLTSDKLSFLESLEPYGKGNPEPTFLTKNFELIDFRLVGVDKNHLKMTLMYEGRVFDAIAFRQGKRAIEIQNGNLLDLVFKPSINFWNGKETLELIVDDFSCSN